MSTIVALNTAAVGQRVPTLLPQQHRGDKAASKHKEEDEGLNDCKYEAGTVWHQWMYLLSVINRTR